MNKEMRKEKDSNNANSDRIFSSIII